MIGDRVMDLKNYYEILGIDNKATITDIENAKNRLKFGSANERVSVSLWNKIDEAYDVLSNPDKRREYDMSLNKEELKPIDTKEISVKPIKKDESFNLKKYNRLRLQKISKPLLIVSIITEELRDIENYNKVLNEQINKSINGYNKDYNLQINIKRYQNQIYILSKILDMIYSKHINSKFELFKYKLEIISIRRLVDRMTNNLNNMLAKIG